MSTDDPVVKAKAEATAGRDLIRFWKGLGQDDSAVIAEARMNFALDELIVLGFGKTLSGQAPAAT